MRFDSVVFGDNAGTAALSCFARLRAERDAGRKTLILTPGSSSGSEAIDACGLAVVRRIDEVEGPPSEQRWQERFAVLIRKIAPKHVLAPIGLLNASRSIDYFATLRDAMSVDKGRDLLFYEERPQALVPEAVPLRLASLGVRLPPASQLRASRAYGPFAFRLITGIGLPPIFGGIRERGRLSSSLRSAFNDTADWDPSRALGPKLQPVIEPVLESDIPDLLSLAGQLGQESIFGSRKSFRNRLSRISATAGSPALIERYWLSLPAQEGAILEAEAV